MRWFKRLGIGAVAAFAILMVIGMLAPRKYKEQAAQDQASASRAVLPSRRNPEWVTSIERTGPALAVTIDVTSHPKDQLVGALGKRILDLAEEHRRGGFDIPEAVDRVLIYGNVELFDEAGKSTGPETAIRASFPRAALVSAATPAQNNWTVFKLADHTSETRVSQMNGLLGKFCDTDFGPQAGDLCRT